MAATAQAAAAVSFLVSSSSSSSSSSSHRTTTTTSISFLATAPALPASLRASDMRAPPLPFLRSRGRGRDLAVVAQLPTAKPEVAAGEKKAMWSARSVKSFAMAELEARKLKYPKTGTEALLMGILVEGTSEAAKFLRANGITLFKVRDEAVKLLGRSPMFFFSPEHPPLTEPAQRALDWAVDEKLKSGEDGEITVTHLLLGIWSEKEAAGHKIMASLGFDDEKASVLAKTANEEVAMSPR